MAQGSTAARATQWHGEAQCHGEAQWRKATQCHEATQWHKASSHDGGVAGIIPARRDASQTTRFHPPQH